MSKIADGDDNAEDLDYRQIIGIATPPKQSQSRQSLFVLELRECGGGATWLGEERDTAPIVRVFCFFGRAKEWGWTVWRDTIGN